MKHAAPRRPRSAAKLGLTLLVVALLGVVAAIGTWSAFSSTTENPGNTFSAGSVSLADNDAGTAMFTMTNMVPASTESGCIKVSYTGTLTSNVRLYGTTTGTGLAPFLNLKVTRGVNTPSDPAFDSCANFSADATEYLGAGGGAGVIFNGTVDGYADSYSAGLIDPTSGSPEAWNNPENHVYKFEVTLQDNNSAQGLNATQAFTWEARNV